MDTRNISAPDCGNSPAFNNGAHYAQKNDAAITFQNFCKSLREFFTSNSARIRYAKLRQGKTHFKSYFRFSEQKFPNSNLKAESTQIPLIFPQFHYLPPFPAPTTIFQTSIRVETHSKNGFYSAVSKAVPIPRRAGKRFELGGILKPQRTEYTPTGTRKCPAATSAILRRSPPHKTSAAKNQPRPISRCKKPKKVRKSY